jgi:hypothetical protein
MVREYLQLCASSPVKRLPIRSANSRLGHGRKAGTQTETPRQEDNTRIKDMVRLTHTTWKRKKIEVARLTGATLRRASCLDALMRTTNSTHKHKSKRGALVPFAAHLDLRLLGSYLCRAS